LQNNDSCVGKFDIKFGKEAKCEQMGQYVSIHRPGYNIMTFAGVSVFIQCNVPTLPYDAFNFTEMVVKTNTTASFEPLSIASNLETYLGVDICGELFMEVSELPPFCTYDNATFIIECSPTLPDHEILWTFNVTRWASEHPLSLSSTEFIIEVPVTPPPPPEPVIEEEPEPEPLVYDPFVPN